MRKGLMVSVAATALLAATGFASAQGMKGNESGASTASPRSEVPSMSKESGGAPMQKDTVAPARDSADTDTHKGSATTAQEKSGTKAMPQQAQQKSDSKSSGTMANDTKSKSMDNKAEDTKASENSRTNDTKSGTAASDTKSNSMNKSSDTKASEQNSPNNAQRPATADSKTGTEKSTTGNAATSATQAPPAEKRTQISSAIRQQKVEEVTNVNFNISVGTRVPTSVHFYPVPTTVVEIYPEWRGYDFIFVHGRYIIVRPETHEIVYIIES